MPENKPNMKRYSFDDVTYLDDALHQLAMYEVSNGLILITKTPEELAALHVKFAEKFNEFKKLIHNGDCTFEFIKQSVLSKNGPYTRKKEHKFDIQDIAEWEKIEKQWVEEDNAINKKSRNMIDSFVDSFIEGIGGFKGKDEDGNEIIIEPLDNLSEPDPESPKSKAKTKDDKNVPPKFSLKDEIEKRKKKKK